MKNNQPLTVRDFHDSMRGYWAGSVYNAMLKNKDIYVVVGDLGYAMWDAVRDTFPDRFINVGAAEQSMLGVSVGLAMEGKIPIVYSITSFCLRRGYETIKLYINDEKIPVILAPAGLDKDYSHDGKSHWAEDAKYMLDGWDNITQYWPQDKEDIPQIVYDVINNREPAFVGLRRE